MSKEMFKREYSHKTLPLKGKWTIELYGPDGQLKDMRQGENLITTNGAEKFSAYLASAALSATQNTFFYVAIGTDSTSAVVADTALGTESSRHTGTVSYTSGGIYEVVATFATGSGTGAIVEYGIFDANSAGTMLNRDVEDAINKGASDTLKVTAQLTVAAG